MNDSPFLWSSTPETWVSSFFCLAIPRLNEWMNELEHVLSHPVVLLMLLLLSETSFSSNLVTLELIVLSLNLMCHFLLESSITSSYVHCSSAPVVPVNIIQFGNHCFKSVIFLPLQGEPESSVSLIHSFIHSLTQILWSSYYGHILF